MTIEELKRHFIQYVEKESVPGMSIAIRSNGQGVFEMSWGVKDRKTKIPLENNARFYIYSVTKVLIAVLALRLVEEGLLKLTTPLQEIIENLPLQTPVTLKQLLNHTAGIPDYSHNSDAYLNAVKASSQTAWTGEEFLQHTLPQGLDFTPGGGWAYSNIGYLLARMMIEKTSGQSLRDLLTNYIIKPLNLKNTFVAETLEDARSLTPGYSRLLSVTGELEDITQLYHPGWVSHGVVVSTATELAYLFEQLFLGELLRAPSLEAIKEAVSVPGNHPLFGKTAYGLGLMIDLQPTLSPVFGHGGEGPGYSTAAFHFSDLAGEAVTITVLANCEGHDIGLKTAFTLANVLGKHV
ncbi:MAG: serine hydrolase domain-containing protein [Trueperaceae bacterium]